MRGGEGQGKEGWEEGRERGSSCPTLRLGSLPEMSLELDLEGKVGLEVREVGRVCKVGPK